GRRGTDRVTVANLEIVSVDVENNILFIAGALPGAINGLITIKGQGELKVNQAPVKTEEKNEQEVKEEVKEEAEKEIKEEKKEEKDEKEVKNEEKKEEAEGEAEQKPADAKQK
ncbi:MAG: hypothetical protein PHH52_02955, partial [Patescibacteria group bacterium]|nr:hypothetical protein [Patescibacteria group bacterium]